jgi:EpsI family protein
VLGIPATMRENVVVIPEGWFRIAEGCSGKRYLVVTLAIAVLAAALNHMRGWRLAVFIAASGLLALIANWIRIVVIIYAGHVTNMQHYLVAKEHLSFGNAVFVVLLVSVVLLARVMDRCHGAAPESRPGAALVASSSAVGQASRAPWAFAPLVLLLATFLLIQLRQAPAAQPGQLGVWPFETGKWNGPLLPDPIWSPAYVMPDGEARASYRLDKGSIEVYASLYGDQRQGRELVYYGNTLLSPGPWERVWTDASDEIGTGLAGMDARAPDGSLWFIARVFEVGGEATRSEAMAQLAYGFRSILRPVPAGVIALATRCDENCDAARALVASFWDDMSGSILAMVPDSVPRVAGQ